MSDYQQRDIGTEDYKITDLVKELREDKFLIPTFQREFVWEPANIIKLWDSMYKFYPIGSVLYWETASYLHTHRKLGGFLFPHDEDAVRKFKEWKYVLDGQQRVTSLLVCMMGGKGRVEGNEAFDYTLYFDATTGSFLFASDAEKRAKSVSNRRFLVRIRDVPGWNGAFWKEMYTTSELTDDVGRRLRQLERVFKEYCIPVVRIRGVEVNEVCEIFERINQEGKKLDPVDIVVARTYRTENPEKGIRAFYLRDNLAALRGVLQTQGNRFQDLDELTVIQMVALCLRKEYMGERNPYGITPSSLDNLTADDFEKHWTECQDTILETIKLLADMRIHGPGMLPYTYLALPLCYYLHRNGKPNRRMARQWFWHSVFGLDDFRASTDVYTACEQFFGNLERGKTPALPSLSVSKSRIVQSSYNYRNALSRAVLALLANQNPIDFSDPKANVLDNVYLLSSQAPNLHHIYPQHFLRSTPGLPVGISPDSLMNICFLRAMTNLQISDRNPLAYFRDFAIVPDFERILATHLIPLEYVQRQVFSPHDWRNFLYARADLLLGRLKAELPDVDMKIAD